jgi:transposase
MYVSTTKRRRKGKTYTNYLIRSSYREYGKVKHKTIANISHLPSDLIEAIRQRLKTGKPLSLDGFSIHRTLPHGHAAAARQMIEQTGLSQAISSRPCREQKIIMGLVAQRLIDPSSKLASYRHLHKEAALSTLGQQLSIDDLHHNEVYEAMDWLFARQERIENKLANKHLQEGALVLYDLSGSYYTGRESELVQYGYNRDGKKDHPQITYGLICNREGCPVSVEVFSGDTADSSTFGQQIDKVRERFGIRRVVWVGDRGMITSRVIDENLAGQADIDWITALRAPQVKKLVRQGAIQLSLFDQTDLAEIDPPAEDFPNQRLIVCKNPLMAEQRHRKRQELLAATSKKLDRIVKATQRKRNPLQGKEEIGVKVGEVINKYKMAKHISYTIEEDHFHYEFDQASIEEEQMLDGLYVVRTSLEQKDCSAEEAVARYKALSHVEWAFRSMKTTRLKVRPIYHWDEERIKTHVFICMLAYYVEWHMRQRLKPFLYDDDHPEQAREKRDSAVAPAQKSDSALQKEQTHQDEHGDKVHSMKTLLDELGTICKNSMAPDNGRTDDGIEMMTEPTPRQKRILEELNVKL